MTKIGSDTTFEFY